MLRTMVSYSLRMTRPEIMRGLLSIKKKMGSVKSPIVVDIGSQRVIDCNN